MQDDCPSNFTLFRKEDGSSSAIFSMTVSCICSTGGALLLWGFPRPPSPAPRLARQAPYTHLGMSLWLCDIDGAISAKPVVVVGEGSDAAYAVELGCLAPVPFQAKLQNGDKWHLIGGGGGGYEWYSSEPPSSAAAAASVEPVLAQPFGLAGAETHCLAVAYEASIALAGAETQNLVVAYGTSKAYGAATTVQLRDTAAQLRDCKEELTKVKAAACARDAAWAHAVSQLKSDAAAKTVEYERAAAEQSRLHAAACASQEHVIATLTAQTTIQGLLDEAAAGTAAPVPSGSPAASAPLSAAAVDAHTAEEGLD